MHLASMRNPAILLVRPSVFFMNDETAVDNFYQQQLEKVSYEQAFAQALKEFDRFAEILKMWEIEVLILNDTPIPHKPDAVFPNNWFSTTEEGCLFIYPMATGNRRLERRSDLSAFLRDHGFVIDKIFDLTDAEKNELFLEGTGSMIIDPLKPNVYAAISRRTSRTLVEQWSTLNNRIPIIFEATHGEAMNHAPVYHTNVVLSVGIKIAIWVPDAIPNTAMRNQLENHLTCEGRELIEISMTQANHFCGNVLEITTEKHTYMVMSSAAYNHFSRKQIETMSQHAVLIHSPLPTIETFGGGSARCMMAEVFLPKQTK
jgi:hypothetical protein